MGGERQVVMRKFLCLLTMALAALFIGAQAQAWALMVDGSVADWGIDLSEATSAGYLDTHKPSGGFSVTEDNTDAAHGWFQVGPGWSNGNYFDAEALYFTNDSTYAYFALVHGLPIEGVRAPGNPLYLPGDIAFDIDQDGSYDFGVDTSSFDSVNKQALLYSTPTAGSWNPAQAFSVPGPWTVNTAQSTSLGAIDFVYSGLQNTHYVLEGRIRLDLLGLNDGDKLFLFWTQQCGNDYLKLDATVMPEPATMMLLAQGLLALGFAGLKKSKKS